MAREECGSKRRRKEVEKKWDWAQVPKKHVLLKISYLGKAYHGIAWQDIDKFPNANTVENELFKALRSCRLIENRKKCSFSRCGRTDRGVHAAANYVSLDLRATREDKPYDYCQILNSLLPGDIRIVNFWEVSPDFDARFSCLKRLYKYFLYCHPLMDLRKMYVGAQHLVGTFDFRNFCKVDPNQTLNYERTIHSIEVFKIASDLVEVQICGSAFLWHQVRCIISILTLIAEGKENENICKELVDISKVFRKPLYEMADERGLVLFDCHFQGINDEMFENLRKTELRELENYNENLKMSVNDKDPTLSFQHMLVEVTREKAVLNCLLGERAPTFWAKTKKKYTKLMKRGTETSLEERVAFKKMRENGKQMS